MDAQIKSDRNLINTILVDREQKREEYNVKIKAVKGIINLKSNQSRSLSSMKKEWEYNPSCASWELDTRKRGFKILKNELHSHMDRIYELQV